jgi:hypothetical protein
MRNLRIRMNGMRSPGPHGDREGRGPVRTGRSHLAVIEADRDLTSGQLPFDEIGFLTSKGAELVREFDEAGIASPGGERIAGS